MFLSENVFECKLILWTVAGETTTWCPEEEKANTNCRWWARVKDEQDWKFRFRSYPRYLNKFFVVSGGGGQHFYVCLGLIWLCSVSIEQAEKNGDSSETKPDAAVSISSSLAGTLDFLFYLAYDVLFVPIFGYIISFPMNKPLDLIKQHYLLKCIQWVLFKWKCK